jgi:hypothetical protein
LRDFLVKVHQQHVFHDLLLLIASIMVVFVFLYKRRRRSC